MESQRLLKGRVRNRSKQVRDLGVPVQPAAPLREVLTSMPGQERLWDELGVDICRHQDESLASVCRHHGLDASTVTRLLNALRTTSPGNRTVAVELLTLQELCDYIESTQRSYLKADLAEVDRLTLNAAHENSSALKVRESFVAFCDQLAAHLHGETTGLFPAIRRLARGGSGANSVGGVKLKPRFARLEREHSQAEDAVDELISLASEGTLEGLTVGVVRTLSAALLRLRHSLAQQVYVENQVLFPRAAAVRGAR